ncbi:MAG: glycosyltransferase, partial [Candidatus Bathyarchaeia archaeon]
MERLPIRGEHSLEFYTSTLFLYLLLRPRWDGNCNLVFNTYGDLAESVADISYINAVPLRLSHLYPGLNPLYKRVASRLYDLSLKGLERLLGRGLMLTNSRFMQGLLKRRMGYETLLVYPPVEVGRFYSSLEEDREDIILTISRLRRGKNLDFVTRVAERVEDGEFIILGLADQASERPLEALEKAIRDERLKDRVKILVNQPLDKIMAILSSAKVYLHTQPMEAFGISVVEAMASGCIPVVPRLGGPWTDILEMREGYYGFSYRCVEEAVARIRMILRDEKMRREVSIRTRSRAKDFDASIFERKILRIIEKLSQTPS